jgi:hypothetical protein
LPASKPFSCEKVFLFQEDNMNNVKILIKNNILFILVEFNFLLSVIGISTAISAVKKEQYNNPFLFSLPLSVVLWVIFAFLISRTQEKEETEEEIEVSGNFYISPARRKISPLLEIILKLIINILLLISVLIILADFTMMLFMTLKTVVVPVFISP